MDELVWHCIVFLFLLKRSMVTQGPIIIIEDDMDDQELLKEIFSELEVPNLIRFFTSCQQAFDYLMSTMEKPFLIISDINVPAMTGLDFCRKIRENEYLRMKTIPFIFLSTTREQKVIIKAYEMSVQGFFVKPNSVDELREIVRMIVGYWDKCRHPYAV